MEIKRKFRPSPFTRELYTEQLEVWVKQKELYDNLINIGLAENTKELIMESYNIIINQIEKANICINTGRLRRGEYPYKRLRK